LQGIWVGSSHLRGLDKQNANVLSFYGGLARFHNALMGANPSVDNKKSPTDKGWALR
jgi:hypothetical protein